MQRLAGKVALITGASAGLGRVGAELFARKGARVVIADRDDGDEVVEAIGAGGGEASYVATDVGDDDSVRAAVDHTVATFGGLDVLYNNAGISPADDDGPENTSDATWQEVLDINVTGIARCCRHGIPAMVTTGGGSIINVASFVAHMGAATPQIAYTASKGAVVAMTREIATMYARRGIRANALCPGPGTHAAPRQVPVRRCPAPAPPRAHSDGSVRRAHRDRARRALLGVGRVVVHDRTVIDHRRWHHRRLHDAGVTADLLGRIRRGLRGAVVRLGRG